MTDALYAAAAKARAAANGVERKALPLGEAKREDVKFHTEFRSPEKVEKNGQDFYLLEGYASMTERAYEMWDMFGPYKEIVSRSAFDVTLESDPMVVYRFNHAGTPMANTRNGRLELWMDSQGFANRAWVNPARQDVQELVTAIRDQDVSEQSFMFTIDDGEWNDDFTEFRINQVGMDRGDVGPVTYGANPYTLVAARSGEFLAAIDKMPELVAREAASRLALRGIHSDGLDGGDVVRAIQEYQRKNGARWNTSPIVINTSPPQTVANVSPAPEPAPAPAPVETREEPKGMSISLALAQLEVDKLNS